MKGRLVLEFEYSDESDRAGIASSLDNLAREIYIGLGEEFTAAEIVTERDGDEQTHTVSVPPTDDESDS